MMYEQVFPKYLWQGPPDSQYIFVFHKLKIPLPYTQIGIDLSNLNVECSSWLNKSDFIQI